MLLNVPAFGESDNTGNISPLESKITSSRNIHLSTSTFTCTSVKKIETKKVGSSTFIDLKFYTIRILIEIFSQRRNNGIQRTSQVPKSKLIMNTYQQHPHFSPILIS